MNKYNAVSRLPENVSREELARLDGDAYSAIPPSGTFRQDSIMYELDHIFDTLNCRILHSVSDQSHADRLRAHGALRQPLRGAGFHGGQSRTCRIRPQGDSAGSVPANWWMRFTGKNGKVFIDIAINHTGWAAKIHETHPEWFAWNRRDHPFSWRVGSRLGRPDRTGSFQAGTMEISCNGVPHMVCAAWTASAVTRVYDSRSRGNTSHPVSVTTPGNDFPAGNFRRRSGCDGESV